MAQTTQPISIRSAYPDDSGAVRRLAALDTAPLPEAPLLVAEVGGDLRAALSLSDGHVIADPFYPTAGLVVLLEVHAARLGQPRWGRSPVREALQAAAAVWRGLTAREPAPEPSLTVVPERQAPIVVNGLLRAQ